MITRYSLNDASTPARSLRILLAEDNAVNQKLAVRLLEKRGHQVTVTGNGREALLALDHEVFDLVLMDVQMPEMDGLEATRLLRQKETPQERRQPVVAMTALVMKGDRERCMEAGMDGYLSKPIRALELDAMLDQYLSLERASHAHAIPAASHESSVIAAELLDRIEGDITLLAELLELFRKEYSGQIRTLRQAVENGDPATLQRVGHALKGALGNLSAPVASNLASQLETIGKAGETDGAEDILNALDPEIDRVVQELGALCLEAVRSENIGRRRRSRLPPADGENPPPERVRSRHRGKRQAGSQRIDGERRPQTRLARLDDA